MARTMPKAGYYVLTNPQYTCFMQEIIYTSGVRGGGGHCSIRLIDYDNFQNRNKLANLTIPKQTTEQFDKKWKNNWVTLLWSCVPSDAELGNDYTYYPTCPPNWMDWK